MSKRCRWVLTWVSVFTLASQTCAAVADDLPAERRIALTDTALALQKRVGELGPWWQRLRGPSHRWPDERRLGAQLGAIPSAFPPRWSGHAAATAPVADPTLWGANGNVMDMARSGNTLYIAGSFRSVGENSGGLAAVDARTGEWIRTFPKVAGTVHAIVPDGSGGWYLGGEFSAVGGKARHCLAQVRADGSVSDWAPSVTGSPGYIDAPAVSAIALSGDRLFVGGGFRELGGRPHENLGCVDARTGAVLEWDLDTDEEGWVYTLTAHDSTVFAGGYFFSVGGEPRSCLAAVDARTGVVRPWQADAGGGVWAILAREDTLLVGGEFGEIAGAFRPFLAALDIRTAQLLPFDAQVNGVYVDYFPRPQVRALALVGDTLYAGGNFTQIGGRVQSSIAALNATTGMALDWIPDTLGVRYEGYPPPGCHVFGICAGTLYVSGTFDRAGGQSRPYAAAFDRQSGKVVPWRPAPDNAVFALAAQGDSVILGGGFGLLGEWKHRAGLAAIDLTTGAVKPWNPNPDGVICTAVAVRGDRVFVSGDFWSIGGDATPRLYLAALDTVNGEVVDWDPGANQIANVFMLGGDTLYMGGEFTQVGGLPRNYLAAINTLTGEVTNWDPSAGWPVFALARRGDTIYLGGIFNRMSGQLRYGLAAVDAVTGQLLPWNPGMVNNSTVRALLPSGDRIYVGGAFDEVGGQPRRGIAALDAATGVATPWYPAPTGWGTPSEIKALALMDSTLYVGGDFAALGGLPRICLAAVDTATGLVTDWDPALDGYVWSLLAGSSALFVGGGFTRAGGLPATGLAAFTLPRDSPPVPVSFGLSQAIPNPVHSSAVLRFELRAAAQVTLTVHDLQGRRVAMVLDGALQEAGRHDLPLQTSGWRPGVYLCRFEAGGKSAVSRMVVVR